MRRLCSKSSVSLHSIQVKLLILSELLFIVFSRKGEAVHKALEKEIHPVEIQVTTTTREDVWGLKLLNMLASMEALLTLGKCRELPVVGFVKGYMVVGVIVSAGAME